jgi:hypothetical protein
VSAKEPEELIGRHEAFLACTPAKRPLLGFWCGGYYPAEQFPHGTTWREGQTLTPAAVRFKPFAEDYEHLFRLHQKVDDDFFYIGSAYWGIPWLEAILGCPIKAGRNNCWAGTRLAEPQAANTLSPLRSDNPWLVCLLQFTDELVRFADGRFPVCPPLLRGTGDVASAMLGAMGFVTGAVDDPAAMKVLLRHCARVRREVLQRIQARIPAWHGTYAAGGYPSKIWCQRAAAYYQEDSAALLSPALFKKFLLAPARQQCAAAQVNFVHLHSACLYPVDALLKESCFDVLEINVDHEGVAPSLAELLPVLKRIQRTHRPLLLWGRFTRTDLQRIRRELRADGLSLQPIVANPGEAAELRNVWKDHRGHEK